MRPLEKTEFSLVVINRKILKMAYYLIIYLLWSMLCVVLLGVFFRYVLNDALSWIEESSKFFMIWMAMMGSPIGLQIGAHVGIDALPKALKGRNHFILLIIIQLLILSLLTVCVVEGIALTMGARMQTALSFDLSLGWIYMAMPLGTGMMVLITTQHLIYAVRGVIDPSIIEKKDEVEAMNYRDFLM